MSILPTFQSSSNNTSTSPRKRPVFTTATSSSSPRRMSILWCATSTCTLLVVFGMVVFNDHTILMKSYSTITTRTSSSSSSFAMILPESLVGSPSIGASPLRLEEEESGDYDHDEQDDSRGHHLRSSTTLSSVTLFLTENLMGSPAIGASPRKVVVDGAGGEDEDIREDDPNEEEDESTDSTSTDEDEDSSISKA